MLVCWVGLGVTYGLMKMMLMYGRGVGLVVGFLFGNSGVNPGLPCYVRGYRGEGNKQVRPLN